MGGRHPPGPAPGVFPRAPAAQPGPARAASRFAGAQALAASRLAILRLARRRTGAALRLCLLRFAGTVPPRGKSREPQRPDQGRPGTPREGRPHPPGRPRPLRARLEQPGEDRRPGQTGQRYTEPPAGHRRRNRPPAGPAEDSGRAHRQPRQALHLPALPGTRLAPAAAGDRAPGAGAPPARGRIRHPAHPAGAIAHPGKRTAAVPGTARREEPRAGPQRAKTRNRPGAARRMPPAPGRRRPQPARPVRPTRAVAR
ncbi:hypothetical protein FQZ97_807220 [compost metagenome]